MTIFSPDDLPPDPSGVSYADKFGRRRDIPEPTPLNVTHTEPLRDTFGRDPNYQAPGNETIEARMSRETEARKQALGTFRKSIIEPFIQQHKEQNWFARDEEIGGQSYLRFGREGDKSLLLAVDPAKSQGTSDNPHIGSLMMGYSPGYMQQSMVPLPFGAHGPENQGQSPTSLTLQKRNFNRVFGTGQVPALTSQSDMPDEDKNISRNWNMPGLAQPGLESRLQHAFSLEGIHVVDRDINTPQPIVGGQHYGDDHAKQRIADSIRPGDTQYMIGRKSLYEQANIFQRSTSQSNAYDISSLQDALGSYKDKENNTVIPGDTIFKAMKRVQNAGLSDPYLFGRPGEIDSSMKEGSIGTAGTGQRQSGAVLNTRFNLTGNRLLGAGSGAINVDTQGTKSVWQKRTWTVNLPKNAEGEHTIDPTTLKWLEDNKGQWIGGHDNVTLNGQAHDLVGNWDRARVLEHKVDKENGKLYLTGEQWGNQMSSKQGPKANLVRQSMGVGGPDLSLPFGGNTATTISGIFDAEEANNPGFLENMIQQHMQQFGNVDLDRDSSGGLVHGENTTPFLVDMFNQSYLPGRIHEEFTDQVVHESILNNLDITSTLASMGTNESGNPIYSTPSDRGDGLRNVRVSNKSFDAPYMTNFRPEQIGRKGANSLEYQMASMLFGSESFQQADIFSGAGGESTLAHQDLTQTLLANAGFASAPSNAINLSEISDEQRDAYHSALRESLPEGASQEQEVQARLAALQSTGLGNNSLMVNGQYLPSANSMSNFSLTDDTGEPIGMSSSYSSVVDEAMRSGGTASDESMGRLQTQIKKYASGAGSRQNTLSAGQTASTIPFIQTQSNVLEPNMIAMHRKDYMQALHTANREQGWGMSPDEISGEYDRLMKEGGISVAALHNPNSDPARQSRGVLRGIDEQALKLRGEQTYIQPGQVATNPFAAAVQRSDFDADLLASRLAITLDPKTRKLMNVTPQSNEEIIATAKASAGKELTSMVEEWTGKEVNTPNGKANLGTEEGLKSYIKQQMARGYSGEELTRGLGSVIERRGAGMGQIYNMRRGIDAAANPLNLSKEQLDLASGVMSTGYQEAMDALFTKEGNEHSMRPFERLQEIQETNPVTGYFAMGQENKIGDTRPGRASGAGGRNFEAIANEMIGQYIQMSGDEASPEQAAGMVLPKGMDRTGATDLINQARSGAISVNQASSQIFKSASEFNGGNYFLNGEGELASTPGLSHLAAGAYKAAMRGDSFDSGNPDDINNTILSKLADVGTRQSAAIKIMSKGAMSPEELGGNLGVIGENFYPEDSDFVAANKRWQSITGPLGIKKTSPSELRQQNIERREAKIQARTAARQGASPTWVGNQTTIAGSEPVSTGGTSTVAESTGSAIHPMSGRLMELQQLRAVSKNLLTQIAPDSEGYEAARQELFGYDREYGQIARQQLLDEGVLQRDTEQPNGILMTEAGVKAMPQAGDVASTQAFAARMNAHYSQAHPSTGGSASTPAGNGSQPPVPPSNVPASAPAAPSGGGGSNHDARMYQDFQAAIQMLRAPKPQTETNLFRARKLSGNIEGGIAQLPDDWLEHPENLNFHQAKIAERVIENSQQLDQIATIADKRLGNGELDRPASADIRRQFGKNYAAPQTVIDANGVPTMKTAKEMDDPTSLRNQSAGEVMSAIRGDRGAAISSTIGSITGAGKSSGPIDVDRFQADLGIMNKAAKDLGAILVDTAKAGGRVTEEHAKMIAVYDKAADRVQKTLKSVAPGSADQAEVARLFTGEAATSLSKVQSDLNKELSTGRNLSSQAMMQRDTGDYAPENVGMGEWFAPFLQKGRAGQRAREAGREAGWYGDSGLTQNLVMGGASALALPATLLKSRYELRGIQQEFLGPMEQARSAYLQSQQSRAMEMSQFGLYGGMNMAGGDLFSSAFSANAKEQSSQLAFGQASNAAFGGYTSALAGAMGGQNVAQARVIGTSMMAGAGAAGIVSGFDPLAMALGGAIGGIGAAGGIMLSGASDAATQARVGYDLGNGGTGNPLDRAGAYWGNLFGDKDQQQSIRANVQAGKNVAGYMNYLNNETPYGGGFHNWQPTTNEEALFGMKMFDKDNIFSMLPTASSLSDDQKARVGLTSNAVMGGLKGVIQDPSKAFQVGDIISSGLLTGTNIMGTATALSTASGYGQTVDTSKAFSTILASMDDAKNQKGGQSTLDALVGMAPDFAKLGQAQITAGQKPMSIQEMISSATGMGKALLTGDVNSQRNIQYGLAVNQEWAQGAGSSGLFTQQMKSGDFYQSVQNETDPNRQGFLKQNLGTFGSMYTQLAVGMSYGKLQTNDMLKQIKNETPTGTSSQVMQNSLQQALGSGANPSNLGDMYGKYVGLGNAGFNASALPQMARYGLDVSGMLNTGQGYQNRSDFVGGTNYFQQMQQGAQLLNQWGAYGGATQANANFISQIAQQPLAQSQFGMAVISGDTIANAQYADQFGSNGDQNWRRFIQTGSRGGTIGAQAGYDERIDSETQSKRLARGSSSGAITSFGAYGTGDYSASQLAGMNQLQIEQAQYGEQTKIRNYDFNLAQTQLNRQQRVQEQGFVFEDKGIALQRGQQDWQYQQQGKQLDLQRQQSAYGFQYQQQSMEIQHSHQQQEAQWGLQNIQYQRDTSQLQFGFSMIDADESIRYSTGRQRRDAMRHRDEATVMQSVQMGHLDTEEQHAKERMKWSDEEFARSKTYNQQERQFQLQNQQLAQQDHQKQGEYIKQERTLEDEKRKFTREISREEMAEAQQSLKVHQQSRITMDNLAQAANVANKILTENRDTFNYMAQTGTLAKNSLGLLSTAIISVTTAANQAAGALGAYQQSLNNNAAIQNSYDHHVLGGGLSEGGPVLWKSFDQGGYTGIGSKYAPAGVVHAGEYVVPQNGSLVMNGGMSQDQANRMIILLQKIYDEGGNAMININNSSPSRALKDTVSLYSKAWSN